MCTSYDNLIAESVLQVVSEAAVDDHAGHRSKVPRQDLSRYES